MILVAVVSQTRFFRDVIVDVVAREPDMAVCCEGPDASSLTAAVERSDLQVVLLDMALPDSVAVVRELMGALPGLRVVALGIVGHERDVIDCAEAGVAGYVTRDDGLDDLLTSIRGVVRGEARCSARTAAMLLRRVTVLAAGTRVAGATVRLTPREVEVVALMDLGLSNKQIAARLQIELATVKNHVHNVLDKLGVHRRGEAVVRARGEGLLKAH